MGRRRRLYASTICLLVVGACIPQVVQAAPTCFGRRATIVGSNRNPTRLVKLTGTPGDDVIVGLGGIDHIDARGGDDLVCAGGGDDYIEAGPGNDKVEGQGGIDDIWGGAGDDRIWGGAGPADSLFGGRGNDRLFGGPGTEDYLFGGPGGDVLDGGAGRDFAMFTDLANAVRVDLRTGRARGQGRDRLRAIENVYGSPSDDVIYGSGTANILAGGPGDDEVFGLGGNDLLRSGWGGEDLLDGGAGRDAATYQLSWDPVHADLGAGQAITSGVDTLVGITDLVGSRFDDTLIGNNEDNVIRGSRGDDVMDGGGGTDEASFTDSFEVAVDLVAGTATEERGSDTLANFENVRGSAFADTIIGDDGPNAFWGGRGADGLVGAGGDDVLIGEWGIDTADGGDGLDTCDAETEIDCELDPGSEAGWDQAGRGRGGLSGGTRSPFAELSMSVASRRSRVSSRFALTTHHVAAFR